MKRARLWRRAAVRGFSALELIVVVAILGMLAAMAIPRFAGAAAGYQVESAAKRVAADLNYARQHARLTSSPQSVTFDPVTGVYSFPNLASPDRSTATYTVNLSRPPYDGAIVSADFGGDATLQFDAFGTPDSGGKLELACGGYTREVLVDDSTGEATTP